MMKRRDLFALGTGLAALFVADKVKAKPADVVPDVTAVGTIVPYFYATHAHSLTTREMPAHTHTLTDPGHSHTSNMTVGYKQWDGKQWNEYYLKGQVR